MNDEKENDITIDIAAEEETPVIEEPTNEEPIVNESVNEIPEVTPEVSNPEPVEPTPTINTVGENPTEEKTQEEPTNIEGHDKKKNNKTLLIVIIAIVLFLCGGIFYVMASYSANSFIDKTVKKINKDIDKFANEYLKGNKHDLLKEDVTSNMTITFNTNQEETKILDGLTLTYDMGLSLKNDLLNLDLGLKQNNANISAAAMVEKEKVLLDLKNMYSKNIGIDLGQNLFDAIKDALKEAGSVSVDSIKDELKTLIKNFGEALKELKPTTKYKGLTVEYSYVLNSSNVKNFCKKFNDLTKDKNSLLTSSVSICEDIGYSDEKDVMYITFSVNVLNGRLKALEIKENKEVLLTIKEDGKDTYKITSEDMTGDLKVNKNEISLTAFDIDTKESLGKMSLIKNKNVTTLEYTIDESTMKITVTKVSDKEYKIEGNVDKIVSFEATATSNDNETTIKGSVKAEVDGAKITVSLEQNNKYGTDLVKANSSSKSVTSIDRLTENDYNEIMNNFTTAITEFEFAKLIGESLVQVQGATKNSFAVEANMVLSAARLYVLENSMFDEQLPSCVTIEELVVDGYIDNDDLEGIVEFTKMTDGTYSYAITVTDGKYSVSKKSESITEYDVVETSLVTTSCPL